MYIFIDDLNDTIDVDRTACEYTGPAQGTDLCAQVEQEGQLHPECGR